MYQLFCSSALLILLVLGVSANLIRENQKNDHFLEPPHCGVGKSSKAPSRIYGGTDVEEGEFPWMVALSVGCGGTLINSRWVLSAAHCFKHVSPKDVKAYLGTIECEDRIILNYFLGRYCDSMAKEFEIEKIIKHEQYYEIWERKNLITVKNDIALLQLKNSVSFTDKIQPICLPYNNQAVDRNIVDKDAVVSGWGGTEYGTPEYLLKATIKIWNARKCENIGKENDREYHICAGGIKGVASCAGDSGGPLLMQLRSSENDSNDHFYQIGVVSFGPTECAKFNYPSVYTNVSTYVPWIRETILKNE